MVIGFKGPAAGGFSAGALVLERPDAHSVCAKLESETFADEAQLVVGEQDCAVISRDGWVAGILGPGRHTLSARIQPFLGSLASTSGYAARISFVTTAPIEDVRFGGPVTLPGAAQVMAFGTLATRVVDPGRLATNLGPATSEDLGRFLGAKILQLVSACAIEWLDKYFTIDTIGGAGLQIAQTIQPHCVFFAELGLDLPRFDGLTLNVRP
jgi:hypothetical protein